MDYTLSEKGRGMKEAKKGRDRGGAIYHNNNHLAAAATKHVHMNAHELYLSVIYSKLYNNRLHINTYPRIADVLHA